MNNPEKFFTRWSRCKHAAAAETKEPLSSVASSPAASEEAVGSERTAGAERSDGDNRALPSVVPNSVEPPFDPLSVPPIESITADTDIRGFLAPGVPPELTRTALRRAWVADPKIRDFVGLADYDWDFNAPGSMAGFGSLEMTDKLRWGAAQMAGPVPTPDRTARTPDSASVKLTPDQSFGEPELRVQARPTGHADYQIGLPQNAPTEKPVESCKRNDLPHHDQESGSPQSRKPETSQLIVHQRHGGALPK
jgi:hypothetical protein